jgi:microcompartment protein CcmK/EutM
MIKKKALLIIGLAFLLSSFSAYMPLKAHAFTPNLLTDDTVFDNTGSMSAAQIDSWLNGFPNSCISPNSGFQAVDPTGYSPGGGYTYGGYVSAGKVIYDASQAYGINPQVLLTTLQKEQSLVSGGTNFCSNGDNNKYAAAVGYGCPDSGTTYSYTGISLYSRNGTIVSTVGPTCVNSAAKAGFSQQVIRAAWLLKFGEQRSEGNTGWAVISGSWDNTDDLSTCYGGPMTQGYRKRCPSDQTSVYYDGYTTIDGTSTHMDTGPTAALYWYTPHFSGNQSFVNIFTGWFGGTVSTNYFSCHNSTNVPATSTGEHVMANNMNGVSDSLSLVEPNNTGSACIEVHSWANNADQQWSQHIATNYPSVNPTGNNIVYADTNGDGKDEAYLVNYAGTGSGMIEIHGWDANYRQWTSHIATNRTAINPADAEVIAADTNGDGKDEFYLVQYRNTSSGKVEIHGWSPSLQQWTSHVATNMPTIDPADSKIIATDVTGNGKDQFVLINYRNTASGMVEVHVWTPDLQNWAAHIATNHPAVDPAYNEVIAAHTNGTKLSQFFLVQYHGTASGQVEVHGWSPNFQQWVSHIATSQGQF